MSEVRLQVNCEQVDFSDYEAAKKCILEAQGAPHTITCPDESTAIKLLQDAGFSEPHAELLVQRAIDSDGEIRIHGTAAT